MTKDEALKQGVEALENIDRWLPTIGQKGLRDYEADALAAMKEALAQPAQEPVARVTGVSFGRFIVEPLNPAMVLPVGMALYSSPQGNK